ncbi:MAG: family 78 glycoside hydrolase catalytic domain [Clostridia bacterium]|nr:family 78 glycoside hydrolase catalytic domain [Clostridia bacterium]
MQFSELFGGASWVTPASKCTAPYMRKVFTTPAADHAELTICGLGHFEGFINGARISEDLFAPAVSDYEPRPERACEERFGEETGHRVYVMRYDVTELLREGENCLGVRLYPGWYGHRSEHPTKLVFRLVIRSAGEVLSVCSDADMRWRRSEIEETDYVRAEHQDAAFLADGFSKVSFDASAWESVSLCGGPEGPFYIQTSPADRVIRHIRPRRIGTTPEGAALYDAGENITGWPVLRETGGAPQTITLTMSENLCGDVLDETRIHRQICTYITDGKNRVWRSRSLWHGFRYFTVEGEAVCEDVLVVHANVPVTSEFSCAEPVLNWIYDAFLRTQLCNMHGGIPSDCPHIERRGYTGDGQLACPAVMTVLDAKDFYLRWIGDISDCQDKKSGHVQYTAPYIRSGGGPGGWGCAIAEVPWQYWKAFGDAEPAKALYPQMLHYFDYLEAHSENGLITSDQPGEWCLGDWCTPEAIAIPAPYVNGYFYIRTLRRVREIALLCGDIAGERALAAREAEKIAVLKENFLDEATGDWCGNIQGANLFALDLGIADDRALESAVAHYSATRKLDTGIFGTDLLFKVLIDHGYADLAFDILGGREAPSFGHWMEIGATTLFEEWKDESRSLSHPMFGSVVQYFFSRLLGIRQAEDSAGYSDMVIAPVFSRRIPSARGSQLTAAGRVSVDWRIFEEDIHLSIVLDPGMNATLRFGGEEFLLSAGTNEFILPAEEI